MTRSAYTIRYGYQKELEHVKKVKDNALRIFNDEVMAPYRDRITCRGQGCIGCCYQLVGCHLFEGVLIARDLMRRGRLSDVADLIQQGDTQMELLGGLPLGLNPDKSSSATEQWMMRKERCALLNADDLCISYALRPSACAAYVVLSDSAFCYPPPRQDVCSLNTSNVTNVMFELDKWFMLQLFNHEGGLTAVYPLGQSVCLGVLLLTKGPDAVSMNFATGR